MQGRACLRWPPRPGQWSAATGPTTWPRLLNLGYELGFLGDRLFAVLVIMALVTTAMTGPLLSLLERRR